MTIPVLLVLIVLALGLWTLATGTYRASLPALLTTVFGTGPKRLEYTVNPLRAPRLLGAIAVGYALGAGGAIFQSTARNPPRQP